MIIDITKILEFVIYIGVVVAMRQIIPIIRAEVASAKAQIGEERYNKILKFAKQVVYATRELDITGELLAIGKDKVSYSWDMLTKLLEQNGIVCDEEELYVYIKAAVTELRNELGEEYTKNL